MVRLTMREVVSGVLAGGRSGSDSSGTGAYTALNIGMVDFDILF